MEKVYEVSVEGLFRKFDHLQALADVSFHVPPGQIFGIVGPDGAGKTTLIRILAGIITYDSGVVTIRGKDMKKDLDDVRNHIGYVSQKFQLYGDLTVEENMDFFAELYPRIDNYRQRKKELLEFIGLSSFTNRLGDNLSGGMKQKLALLCALIHNPSLLLMDEPTTGVDPVSRREFWQIVFDLQRKGLTVLASTPYMDEAEQFDRVALINRGRFMKTGTADQIRESVPGAVVEVVCSDPSRARKILRESGKVKNVELFGDKVHVFLPVADSDSIGEISDKLESAGIGVDEIAQTQYSIEDIFLNLLSGEDSAE